MDLLNNLLGTNFSHGVSLAILFVGLLVLLLLFVWLIRKLFGNRIPGVKRSRQPRLSVTDAAIVDEKRRLVLVRRDDIEHLVMIGGPSDIVVEQNIQRLRPVVVPTTQVAPAADPSAEAAPKSNTPAVAVPAAVGATAAVVGTAANSAASNVAAAGSSVTNSIGGSLASAGSSLNENVSDFGATALDKVSSNVAVAKEAVSEKVEAITEKIDGGLDSAIETKSAIPSPTTQPINAPKKDIEDDMQSLLDELASEKKI